MFRVLASAILCIYLSLASVGFAKVEAYDHQKLLSQEFSKEQKSLGSITKAEQELITSHRAAMGKINTEDTTTSLVNILLLPTT